MSLVEIFPLSAQQFFFIYAVFISNSLPKMSGDSMDVEAAGSQQVTQLQEEMKQLKEKLSEMEKLLKQQAGLQPPTPGMYSSGQ